MNEELLRQCIADILEQAEIAKGEPHGDFRDGKLLAYNEVLSVLKTNLTPLGPEKFGLGFDLDRKLA